MTEAVETALIDPPAPVKKAPKKRKAKRRVARPKAEPKAKDQPVYKRAGDLAGISATKCPAACTADHCVISTVGQCKHPYKSGDGGCGPITMANRARAKKLIKHQIIELKE